MKTVYLVSIMSIVTASTHLLLAQTRPLSVCEALNSAADHQAVLIHATVASTRHGSYLFEGTGQDPCPGWRKRFFTAPAAIPIVTGSYGRVHVPADLFRSYFDFEQRMNSLRKADPSAHFAVTISGVIIRKKWPLIFWSADGEYVGWGEGANGGSAAVLVVTSAPIEDRR